jgi:hypothetical protein
MTLSTQRLEKAAREISNLAWRLEGSPGDNGYYAMQRRAAIKKAREIISAYLGDTRVDVPREPFGMTCLHGVKASDVPPQECVCHASYRAMISAPTVSQEG